MAMKDLAIQAAEDAFKDGVKKAASALSTALILAKSDQDRETARENHKHALVFCQQVLEIQRAEIQVQFP